jgi:acyl carrier protein
MTTEDRTPPRDALAPLILDTLIAIAPDVDPNTLDPDVAFRDQFEIDSVDFLNFVVALERELDRRIPETDFPKLSSLKGALDYLSGGD